MIATSLSSLERVDILVVSILLQEDTTKFTEILPRCKHRTQVFDPMLDLGLCALHFNDPVQPLVLLRRHLCLRRGPVCQNLFNGEFNKSLPMGTILLWQFWLMLLSFNEKLKTLTNGVWYQFPASSLIIANNNSIFFFYNLYVCLNYWSQKYTMTTLYVGIVLSLGLGYRKTGWSLDIKRNIFSFQGMFFLLIWLVENGHPRKLWRSVFMNMRHQFLVSW